MDSMDSTSGVQSDCVNNIDGQSMLQEPERADVIEQSNPSESAALPSNDMTKEGQSQMTYPHSEMFGGDQTQTTFPPNEMFGGGHTQSTFSHSKLSGGGQTQTSEGNGQPGTYPVSREMLQSAAKSLIDEMNAKRKRDTTLLTDFKKNIEIQVSNSCAMLEQALYQTYQHNGTVMQEKLQELFATLDRIATLEAELDEFKHALGMLYKDIAV